MVNDKKFKSNRIVAIDYGLARIGLALSDERKIIASPLMTISTEKKGTLTISKLLNELTKHQTSFDYNIEEIIIGMPLMMNGTTGFLADEVAYFASLLGQSTPIPIITWDERLTTVQAERSLREGSMNRKKRSKIVDTISASILLQSYLDYKNLKT